MKSEPESKDCIQKDLNQMIVPQPSLHHLTIVISWQQNA